MYITKKLLKEVRDYQECHTLAETAAEFNLQPWQVEALPCGQFRLRLEDGPLKRGKAKRIPGPGILKYFQLGRPEMEIPDEVMSLAEANKYLYDSNLASLLKVTPWVVRRIRKTIGKRSDLITQLIAEVGLRKASEKLGIPMRTLYKYDTIR